MYASEKGYSKIVDYLLERNVEVDIVDVRSQLLVVLIVIIIALALL